MLKNFTFAKYTISIKPVKEIFLPEYKGGVFRGGLGSVFRRLCCVNKKEKNCLQCPLKDKCAYVYIFETITPKNTKKLKSLQEIPRPFVIEPPEDTKQKYNENDILNFNLILIGKAISFLPYFILTFKELGNTGIGSKGKRGKYILLRISDSYGEEIYNFQDDVIKNINSEITLSDILSGYQSFTNHQLSLSFLTPTRIKYQLDLVVKPEFHIIIRSLLHRISALSYFHCDEELKINFKHLISQAEKVSILKSNLKWYDWERYSLRQNAKMKLGGFIGEITYEGDFTPFLPLILLGEYVHIGKNCTFGLGKYKIQENKNA